MQTDLRITFVLPTHGNKPIGGYKVVYEYASHLARRGHRVIVVHPQIPFPVMPALVRARGLLTYTTRRLRGNYGPESWFQVDPAVRLLWVWSLHERHIPDADVIISTCWETAEAVARYSAAKGRSYNLIQHWETWSGPEERVRATWKLPLRKIVIASWLRDIADELGESCILIPNGLDFSRFRIDIPPVQRNRAQAMMLYHWCDWKGSVDGLEAFSAAKREIPELRVSLFGTPEKPDGLPSWVTYYRKPEQSKLRALYNQAAVFVSPSWTEGWPLPPAEAMMCGAALAATDIGGHREYAIHGETALLSPAKTPAALADNILRLIRDDEFRFRIAEQGNGHIQQFTWERAVDLFEATLHSR